MQTAVIHLLPHVGRSCEQRHDAWYQADFNFDGIVNDTDVSIASGFYNPTALPLSVPGPATLAILILASLGVGGIMRKRSGRRALFALSVLAAAAWSSLLGLDAHAATTNWIANSGQFTTAGNWDNGVPGSLDLAVFNRGPGFGYTVSFPGGSPFVPPLNYVIDDLLVRSNEVTFAKVVDPFTGNPSLTIDDTDTIISIGIFDDVAILNTTLQSLSGGNIAVGASAAANGTLNVNAGALNMSGQIWVGNFGTGTLNIRNGSDATSNTAFIGKEAGSSGVTTVIGVGSTWANTSSITVGNLGAGTLRIEAGASVSSSDGLVTAGAGSAGTVTIAGRDSRWDISESLRLGGTSTSHADLRISDGASLSAKSQFVGDASGSSVTATVTGAGSNLNGELIGIGVSGTAALTIEAGGSLTADTVEVASFQGSAGSTTVRGANSKLTVSDRFFVGTGGPGAVAVEDGAIASTKTASLGAGGLFPGTNTNGTVTVSGAGSTWNNAGFLNIGGRFSGTLMIKNGGAASTSGVAIDSPGSGSFATIEDPGSTWTTGDLLVAGNGSGTLTIKNGGGVSSTDARLAVNNTAVGTATVRGAGSTWTNSGALIVGEAGKGTLAIQDGASVTSSETRIGNGNGAGALEIQSGGRLSNINGIVAGLGSSDGTVTVTGAGSTWTNNGDLTVGGLGAAELTIADRGEVLVAGSLSANALSQIRLHGGKLTVNQFGAGALDAINWQSGTLRLTAASGLTIGPSGLFGSSLALDAGQGLEVDNMLTIQNGSELFSSGRLSAGSLLNNGELILSSTTVNGPVSNAANANITAIGNVNFNGLVSGPGRFWGPGTFTFSGGMSPGASPAAVSFENDVVFASSNTLYIELGGTTPGTQHDQINIGGEATLNGTLDLVRINGFVLAAGDAFTIMTFGSHVGTFPTVTGTSINPNLQLVPVYSATDLRIITASTGEKTWGVDAGGLFSVGSNWVGGVAPTGASESVAFTTVISANRTIDIDVAASLISMRFDDNNNYTLAGTGPIRFHAAGPAVANLTVQYTHGNGAHTINTPIEILGDLVITQDSTQPLTIGGPLDGAPTRSITKAGVGTVVAARVRAAALTVNAGSMVIAPNGGNSGTSVTDTLDVSGTSRLDLNNNDLVVHATAATKDAVHNAIEADIKSAQNGLDAALITRWDGPGITSSTARTTNVAQGFDLTGIGVIRNSDLNITTGVPGSTYTTFSGQPVTQDDVLVKYTYTGDANLSGAVTFDDYVGMDNAFFGLIPNLGWATGDINFDGVINFDDYSKVDQAFFFQSAPLAHADVAAVPEPAAVLLIALGPLFVIGMIRAYRGPNLQCELAGSTTVSL